MQANGLKLLLTDMGLQSAELGMKWSTVLKLWIAPWVHMYFAYMFVYRGPPLCYSGHSSCIQIRRSGFDSRHYQKKKVVGLERGPLSLVSTTEKLLDRKVTDPV
jgi:hypothetical protein